MQQYTNEITPEINEAQSQPPYDEELLSLCDDKTRKELEEIKKQHLSRPLAHIFPVCSRWKSDPSRWNHSPCFRRCDYRRITSCSGR